MRQRNQLAGPRLILGVSLLLVGVAIYQLAVELTNVPFCSSLCAGQAFFFWPQSSCFASACCSD